VIPLSVLDLSPVTTATPGSAALHNSLDLARLADSLGYKRYWLAEHHNLANIASSSPDIMIGQVAAVTSRIRVGSGGVMLPNHAPLMVAERFKVLEALFPGRIDLGLGRAPGTDPVTSYALRARQDPRGGDEFLERFQELLLLEHGGFPDGHPFRNVRAVPSDVPLPPLWLLGSSGYSAQVAGLLGLPFAFAHHFSPANTLPALALYREHFRPSEALDRPYAMVAAAVVCADTDDRARWLAGSGALSFLKLRSGRPGPLPSPQEAEDYPYTHLERAYILDRQATQIIGAPETVRRGLTELLKETAADELMLTTMVFDPADRLRSFELVADLARTPHPEGQPAQTAT